MTTMRFLADERPCTLCGAEDCRHLGGPQHNAQRHYAPAFRSLGVADLLTTEADALDRYGAVLITDPSPTDDR